MPSNKQSRRLSRYLKKWVPRLRLGDLDITVDIVDKLEADDSDHSENLKTYAQCFPDWKYMTARLVFVESEISTMSDWRLEQGVIHELLHVVVSVLNVDYTHVEEYMVTMLEKALMEAEYGKSEAK